MSTVKHFIDEAIRDNEINEFLEVELDRAGFGGVNITRTPMGTRITVYAMRPGTVIGRRGSNIRELARELEERFNLPNPQIAVSEIEVPELNPNIMASQIANALQRGIYFRRTGFWTLNKIMRSGAQGAEITLKGKLRTKRHRVEKYRQGYLPQSGDPAEKYIRTAVSSAKMKPGIIGIKVKIVPPDAEFPDRFQIIPSTKDVSDLEKKEDYEESQ